MTDRRDARRDYRHFPPEYADLLRQFNHNGYASLGPMTLKEARASARDLYRFKMFLSRALDEDSEDTYARELFDIFASASVLVQDNNIGQKFVVLNLNPIVAAMRRIQKGSI